MCTQLTFMSDLRALDRTRTCTTLRSLEPKSSVSTNSTTRALRPRSYEDAVIHSTKVPHVLSRGTGTRTLTTRNQSPLHCQLCYTPTSPETASGEIGGLEVSARSPTALPRPCFTASADTATRGQYPTRLIPAWTILRETQCPEARPPKALDPQALLPRLDSNQQP